MCDHFLKTVMNVPKEDGYLRSNRVQNLQNVEIFCKIRP